MRRRWPAVVALIIGLGVAFAPAMFQMFSRAPKGGTMINEFRPYMTERKVTTFRGYMLEIGQADRAAAPLGGRFTGVADLHRQWAGIDADMGDMLDRMDRSLDNFEAVDALPPFPMFPWFFVLPGLIGAGLAFWLYRSGSGRVAVALAVLGVGLIAAPAIFQMFTRAPKGAEMIDDFRPLMSTKKVTTVQGYFLTIGAAEGELRTQAGPAADAPEIRRFVGDWPQISNEFAPMIGAMSDNVDNYEAVDALPPFNLFPWFFVIPGVLIAGFALAARPRRSS